MSTKNSNATSVPAHSLFWTYTDLLCLLVIALATGCALLRFWAPGIASSADMLMGIYRVFELAQAWRYGILYPRLGPDLNFGYGAPLFEFYPPLASYSGLLLHWAGLGLIAATKATATLAILLAGVGMYGYARQLLQNRCAALVSAILYGFAPYLLLDVYERGAVAELLALMFLPWLFWSLHTMLASQRPLPLWLAAGLLAALMLAHNITAFWAIPTAGLYFGLLALSKRQFAAILRLAFAFGVGLGLSAFYWLPALLEIKFTHAAVYMLQKPAEFAQNLVNWSALIQPTWLFQYQGPLRFRFSLLQAGFALVGAAALPMYAPIVRRRLIGLVLFLVVSLCLQLQSTLDVWQQVPFMRFIQFPWRLLGLAAFCTAILGGALFTWRRLPTRFVWPLALGICTLFVGANIQHLKPEQLPFWYLIDEAGINQQDLFARGARGYALFSDYSPIDLHISSNSLSTPRADMNNLAASISAAPHIRVLEENPVYLRLAVEAPTAFPWRFSRLFFPGWQVYVDGRAITTTASGAFGLVTAQLPAGNYTLTAQFEQTPIRRLANGLTIVALVIWSVLLIQLPRRRAQWLVRGVVAVLVIGLLVYSQLRAQLTDQPTALPVNFQDQFHLLGYNLTTTRYHPGQTVRLRLYWFAQQTPTANYKIFLHLAELDDTGKVAQADSEPTYGYTPMTTWEPGEIFVDEQILPLAATIKPGHYKLLMGVYHPETVQNLAVRSAPQVLPGERVVITELEIVHE